MKNKYFKILFWISVFLFIIDLILTKLSPYYEALEANMLFRLTGGFFAIVILNIAFLVSGYVMYHISKIEFMRFFAVNSLIILNFIRSLAIENHIKVILLKPEEKIALTQIVSNAPELIVQTNIAIYVVIFSLALVSMLTFVIWHKDNQNI